LISQTAVLAYEKGFAKYTMKISIYTTQILKRLKIRIHDKSLNGRVLLNTWQPDKNWH